MARRKKNAGSFKAFSGGDEYHLSKARESWWTAEDLIEDAKKRLYSGHCDKAEEYLFGVSFYTGEYEAHLDSMTSEGKAYYAEKLAKLEKMAADAEAEFKQSCSVPIFRRFGWMP